VRSQPSDDFVPLSLGRTEAGQLQSQLGPFFRPAILEQQFQDADLLLDVCLGGVSGIIGEHPIELVRQVIEAAVALLHDGSQEVARAFDLG